MILFCAVSDVIDAILPYLKETNAWGKKNGPPLAQGARRGVITLQAFATGGGGAYPRCSLQAMAYKGLMSSRFDDGSVAGKVPELPIFAGPRPDI